MSPLLITIVAGAVVSSLGAAAAMSILLRRLQCRLDESDRRNESTAAELRSGIESLLTRAAACETRLAVSENRVHNQSEWAANRESVHLNKRGQVLRLHQKGSSLPEIASALRVSQAEAKLIIKVHESLSEQSLEAMPTEKVLTFPGAAAQRLASR